MMLSLALDYELNVTCRICRSASRSTCSVRIYVVYTSHVLAALKLIVARSRTISLLLHDIMSVTSNQLDQNFWPRYSLTNRVLDVSSLPHLWRDGSPNIVKLAKKKSYTVILKVLWKTKWGVKTVWKNWMGKLGKCGCASPTDDSSVVPFMQLCGTAYDQQFWQMSSQESVLPSGCRQCPDP